jgi:hypothetical protein
VNPEDLGAGRYALVSIYKAGGPRQIG